MRLHVREQSRDRRAVGAVDRATTRGIAASRYQIIRWRPAVVFLVFTQSYITYCTATCNVIGNIIKYIMLIIQKNTFRN